LIAIVLLQVFIMFGGGIKPVIAHAFSVHL
jgi:hypothetical protein